MVRHPPQIRLLALWENPPTRPLSLSARLPHYGNRQTGVYVRDNPKQCSHLTLALKGSALAALGDICQLRACPQIRHRLLRIEEA